jgi:hypothetical protein
MFKKLSSATLETLQVIGGTVILAAIVAVVVIVG